MTDIIQEREGWADGVYLNMKKKSDKVPHESLIWKIKNIGDVGEGLSKWLKVFLTNGEMRTIIMD